MNCQTIRKGTWTKQEDNKLLEIVRKTGPKNWRKIGKLMGVRIGKQCRERWHNHLDPQVDKTPFSAIENKLILTLHNKYGNKWATIAKHFEGRRANFIKNHWNIYLSKYKLRVKKLSLFQILLIVVYNDLDMVDGNEYNKIVAAYTSVMTTKIKKNKI